MAAKTKSENADETTVEGIESKDAKQASTENSAKLKAFEDMLGRLNKSKRFAAEVEEGDAMISLLSSRPLEVETTSSGSVVLDSILGGGIPKGRIIEIFGPEASGKTSIALTAAANVQKEGGTVAFIDLEHALDPKYARVLGVDTDKLALAQPGPAEVALDLVTELVESRVVDLIIIDSIGAMSPRKELEGSAEDNSMAAVARLLSQHLRSVVSKASKTKTTLIFINQIREKVGFVLGNPEVTMGGKAMKFFASQRIDIRRREKIVDDNKETIGNAVKMRVIKNKVAPPYGEGMTVLTFGQGINRAAELIETAPEWGVIEKPSKVRYLFEGEQIGGSSKAKAIAALEEDTELAERIATKLREVMLTGVKPKKDSASGEDD